MNIRRRTLPYVIEVNVWVCICSGCMDVPLCACMRESVCCVCKYALCLPCASGCLWVIVCPCVYMHKYIEIYYCLQCVCVFLFVRNCVFMLLSVCHCVCLFLFVCNCVFMLLSVCLCAYHCLSNRVHVCLCVCVCLCGSVRVKWTCLGESAHLGRLRVQPCLKMTPLLRL